MNFFSSKPVSHCHKLRLSKICKNWEVENVPLLPSDTHAPSGGPNLETFATQLSRKGLEEIWSPYSAANLKVPKIHGTDGASPSIFYIPRTQSTSSAQTLRISFFVLILLYFL